MQYLLKSILKQERGLLVEHPVPQSLSQPGRRLGYELEVRFGRSV